MIYKEKLLSLSMTYLAVSGVFELWHIAQVIQNRYFSPSFDFHTIKKKITAEKAYNEEVLYLRVKFLSELYLEELERNFKTDIIKQAYRDMGYKGSLLINFDEPFRVIQPVYLYGSYRPYASVVYYPLRYSDCGTMSDEELYATAAVGAAKAMNWHYRFINYFVFSCSVLPENPSTVILLSVASLLLAYYFDYRDLLDSAHKLQTGKDLKNYNRQFAYYPCSTSWPYLSKPLSGGLPFIVPKLPKKCLTGTPDFFKKEDYRKIQRRRESATAICEERVSCPLTSLV